MRLQDAEAMVGQYLRTATGEQVSTLVPSPRPERFVRAWRTGGPASSRVLDEAQITVQAWDADSTSAASELMRQCRDALWSAARREALPLVRRVYEVGGPYYDPDPQSGTHRYSMTVALRIRAART